MEIFCKWCDTKHAFCDSCGIGIGHNHKTSIDISYKIKSYTICDYCYNLFVKLGYVSVGKITSNFITIINSFYNHNQ